MKELVKKTLRRVHLLGIASLAYRAAQPRSLYHNIPYWLQGAADGLPIPPLKLRSLVWAEYADIRNFFQEQRQAQFLMDVLAQDGAEMDDFQAILDFGCGAGRAIRQFSNLKKPLQKARVCGSDINSEQIDWCKRNLPFAEFEVNQPHPPLAYTSEEFDFVYTFSVFTHLPESQQYLWINELARVLKPGGYLLITTCGESYFETLTENEREEFRQGRLVVRNGELAGIPSTYAECIAFHPTEYVKKKLSTGFDLIHFSPGVPLQTGPKGEMDHYFLRKPASIHSAVVSRNQEETIHETPRKDTKGDVVDSGRQCG